jgi:S-formylglutathione hydrolase FrmB
VGYAPGTPGAALYGTQWPQHDPTVLAANLLSIPLFVASGNGTPGNLPGEDDSSGARFIEAQAYLMARDFVNAVASANGGPPPVTLTTDFYGDGTHSWAYWDAEICRSLPILMAALRVLYKQPVACPGGNLD